MWRNDQLKTNWKQSRRELSWPNRSMHFPEGKEEKQVQYRDTWGPIQNLKEVHHHVH